MYLGFVLLTSLYRFEELLLKYKKNRLNSIAISTFNQINVLSQLCYFHALSENVNIQIPSINEKTNLLFVCSFSRSFKTKFIHCSVQEKNPKPQ